ncbi:MAG: cell shape-determining protein MreB, partial [Bacteroidota bacterium]
KSLLLTDVADAQLTDPFNNAAPNLKPAVGSPLLAGALFDFGALSDAFFDKVTYIGALDGTTDWTAQWSVWGK